MYEAPEISVINASLLKFTLHSRIELSQVPTHVPLH